jgi:hypothetical protein
VEVDDLDVLEFSVTSNERVDQGARHGAAALEIDALAGADSARRFLNACRPVLRLDGPC